jgi:hypothetical protein
VYQDFWISNIWNNYRASRIIVNEIILEHLVQLPSYCAISSEYHLLSTCCRATLIQLVVDICASTPYHFSKVTSQGDCRSDLDKPMLTALGGLVMIWPLYIAADIECSPPSLKSWVIRQLNIIGYRMGIRQALLMTELLHIGKDVDM